MESQNSELKSLLISTKSLVYIATCGSGPRMLEKFWDDPGASEYFAGGFFPYKDTVIDTFVGRPLGKEENPLHISYELAMASFINASETIINEKLDKSPVGIGIRANVPSDHDIDELYAHIVVITKDKVQHVHMPVPPRVGKAARQEDDGLIADTALNLLERTLSTLDTSPEAESIIQDRLFKFPVFNPDGTRGVHDPDQRTLYLSSILNPLSTKHRILCRAGEETLVSQYGIGKFKACYLVSTTHPEGPVLNTQDMLYRAGMIRAERWKDQSRSVEFTQDSLYIEKARNRPGSVFIIGVDNLIKLLDPKWGVDINSMLREMANLKIRFLVMGCEIDGKWMTCRDVNVPWPHSILFMPLNGRIE